MRDRTAPCFYCGKEWPISRMYAKRDRGTAGNTIGYQCQDLTACRHRSEHKSP